MLYRIRRRLGSPRPFKKFLTRPAPSEIFEVPTEDGLTLVLRRVPPKGRPTGGPPIMLLHGLAANHRTFHFPRRSLAAWLSRRGHDVWLPNLRGHGDSPAHAYGWGIDEYLNYDIPAIIETILRHSEADKIQWVGHSMGGILLMCYGIRHDNPPIARGITLGSALDYKVGKTGFNQLLRLRPVIQKLVAFPFGTVTHLLSPLMGRGVSLVEGFNVWPSNIEPEMIREFHASCFHTIPVSLLQSLATTFEPRGLKLKSGYCFVEEAADFPFPILLVAGSKDAQVAVDAVHHTAELLGENARVHVRGKYQGDADHYGHWDLIIGRRAQREVWPSLAKWIEFTEP